ncbi:MAG: DNA translocase FtsK [Candidatus Marinimicrobia bacterium]|nr:DNA translocase FtsK [Candidatus Neomarinimicrobiota bacterium]MDA1363584.1 DNA translocase FtsK [Candidatus Neomarinimicrobiota bacterium]
MKDKLKIQIIGLLLLIISLLITGSMIGYDSTEEPTLVAQKINNPFNILGVYIGFYLMKLGFGYAALLIPIILATISFYFISNFSFNFLRLLRFQILLLILLSVLLGFFSNLSFLLEFKEIQNFEDSGLLGGLIFSLIYDWTGFYGSVLILFSSLALFLVSFFKIDLYKSLKDIPSILINKISKIEFDFKKIIPDFKKENGKKEKVKIVEDDSFLENINTEESIEYLNQVVEKETSAEPAQDTEIDTTADKPKVEVDQEINQKEELDAILIEKAIIEKEAEIDDQRNKSILKVEWKFPSTDILKSSDESSEINEDDIRGRSELLKNSLSNFGVEGSSGAIKTGPIITLFEILPAEGVRVNKFVQLSDDIARVMEAQSVRVLAPIPGSNYVGVEIPNVNPQTIYLKNVINSEKYLKSKAKLKLAIGKGTLGDISILDLVEMPHLLIAGTTGSGKSVSLNTIIVSLLYQLKPEEVKFVIIDPKKVEMSLYRGLENHYLLKFNGIDESIITKKDNAILALRSLEREMDSRYDLLAEAGKRNISEYNNDMMKKSKKDLMPYIVLMIDELADLMMYSPRDVEAPIARLAQLARAVGIHLIVATQRPSVDVITGVIKANFPARIAFQVATKIDSRTILDENGADKLIGKGDMLYQKPGSPAPVRMHGAFITLNEIEDLVAHISSQPKPSEVIIETYKEESSSMVDGDSIDDDLLHKAIEIIVMSKQGSISLLQRRLSVGYSRAARLIDEMERLKIVGPFTGSKAREVLVDEAYLETINED